MSCSKVHPYKYRDKYRDKFNYKYKNSNGGFHSMRAGGATAAYNAGATEAEIKLHGNWRSDAVKLYIHPNTEQRLKASGAMGKE